MPLIFSLDDYECVEQFKKIEDLLFRLEELESTLRSIDKKPAEVRMAYERGVYELAWTSQSI